MTSQIPTLRLTNAGRWLAIMAVGVLLFGKLVHLGQECGGCCSSHCHVSQQNSGPSERPCLFGCEHHSQNTPQVPNDSESPDGHDEHDCVICSVLSHVTQCAQIVGLPAESQIVVANIWAPESTVTIQVLFPVDPRGSPRIPADRRRSADQPLHLLGKSAALNLCAQHRTGLCGAIIAASFDWLVSVPDGELLC